MNKSLSFKSTFLILTAGIIYLLLTTQREITLKEVLALVIAASSFALMTGYELYLRRRDEMRAHINAIHNSINSIVIDGQKNETANLKKIFQRFSQVDANFISSGNRTREELKALISLVDDIVTALSKGKIDSESNNQLITFKLSQIDKNTEELKKQLEKEILANSKISIDLEKRYQDITNVLNDGNTHSSKLLFLIEEIKARIYWLTDYCSSEAKNELAKINAELSNIHIGFESLLNRISPIQEEIKTIHNKLSPIEETTNKTSHLTKEIQETISSSSSSISNEIFELRRAYPQYQDSQDKQIKALHEQLKEMGARISSSMEIIGAAQKKVENASIGTQALLEAINSSLEVAAKIDLESKEKLLELFSTK